ncbi:hypothetical protein [Citricoccus alkalitolerans]|uniref:Uncharacterized protein n=1 Tax=Citricoccus alkalitolerans TaxID=246603 RepID=A0ABV8XXW5_9MICC
MDGTHHDVVRDHHGVGTIGIEDQQIAPLGRMHPGLVGQVDLALIDEGELNQSRRRPRRIQCSALNEMRLALNENRRVVSTADVRLTNHNATRGHVEQDKSTMVRAVNWRAS